MTMFRAPFRALTRRTPTPRRTAGLAATVAAVTVTVAAASVTAASAAQPTPTGNPVAGHPWGIYTGNNDPLWPTYEASTGTTRTLLGKMALQPRVRWYSNYIPASDVASKIRMDITAEQHGDPNVLVWMATFRLWPQQEVAKSVPLTTADQDAYKQWVDNAAAGIGSSRVGLIVEPDLAVSLTGWRPSVRLALARYAVRAFTALPNATVYIDAGSADWLTPQDAASLLIRAGVQYARGFALGSTHNNSTAAEIAHGRSVAVQLAKRGYPGKHFVVDTSDNGHPFTNAQFYAKYPNGSAEDVPGCKTATERDCISLGIPPTTRVGAAAWGLPSALARAARHRCDAYVWTGRPWRADNDKVFDVQKALDAARTSPYD